MLAASGDYHVKVRAETAADGYQSKSSSINSDPVHVYQVSVNITGIGADRVTVGRRGSYIFIYKKCF